MIKKIKSIAVSSNTARDLLAAFALSEYAGGFSHCERLAQLPNSNIKTGVELI